MTFRYEAHVVDKETYDALKLGVNFRNGRIVEGIHADDQDWVLITQHDDPANAVFARKWPPRPLAGGGVEWAEPEGAFA